MTGDAGGLRWRRDTFSTLPTFPYCSYTKIILGPRYSVRLEDLQASDCVFARCMACGRVWRIAPHRLFDRFPPDERMKTKIEHEDEDEVLRAFPLMTCANVSAPSV